MNQWNWPNSITSNVDAYGNAAAAPMFAQAQPGWNMPGSTYMAGGNPYAAWGVAHTAPQFTIPWSQQSMPGCTPQSNFPDLRSYENCMPPPLPSQTLIQNPPLTLTNEYGMSIPYGGNNYTHGDANFTLQPSTEKTNLSLQAYGSTEIQHGDVEQQGELQQHRDIEQQGDFQQQGLIQQEGDFQQQGVIQQQRGFGQQGDFQQQGVVQQQGDFQQHRENQQILKNQPNAEIQQLQKADSLFEAQFKSWEEQFNSWKEENKNHPDKSELRIYEREMLQMKNSLLRRRYQLRCRLEEKLARLEERPPRPITPVDLEDINESEDVHTPALDSDLSGGRFESVARGDRHGRVWYPTGSRTRPSGRPPLLDHPPSSDCGRGRGQHRSYDRWSDDYQSGSFDHHNGGAPGRSRQFFSEQDVFVYGVDPSNEEEDLIRKKSTQHQYSLGRRSRSPWKSSRSPIRNRHISPSQRGRLSPHRDSNYSQQGHKLSPHRDKYSMRRDRLSPRRDRISQRRERISPRRERISPRRVRLSPRRENAAPRRDRLSPRRDHMSPRRDRLSPRRDRLSPRRDRLSPRRDHLSQRRDCLSPRRGRISTHHGHSFNHGGQGSPPRTRDRLQPRSSQDQVHNRSHNIRSETTRVVRSLPSPKQDAPSVDIIDLVKPPGRLNRPSSLVVIFRGPPGSGKTYTAKLVKDQEVENKGSAPRILSLDDYFCVEKEKQVIDESGKPASQKVMEYEYDAAVEDVYRSALEKAFKKTIDDGFFHFIILDCVNNLVSHFDGLSSYASSRGFKVYVVEMEMDVPTCHKRNIHGRSSTDIKSIVDKWERTPSHFIRVDVRKLIQEDCIQEVEMEDITNQADVEENDAANSDEVPVSKWEKMEPSEERLNKLDGVVGARRRLEHQPPRQTMQDYLQLSDDYYSRRQGKHNKKRVRWADIEEQNQQKKARDIGFVVGQTDWSRITDPTFGHGALTQTKYI